MADGHLILHMDTSNASIGAALSQLQQEREVQVAFAINTILPMRPREITKREFLAVVV